MLENQCGTTMSDVIYIAMESRRYDGDYILGIYRDSETAVSRCLQVWDESNQAYPEDVAYSVEQWHVGESSLHSYETVDHRRGASNA